MYNRDIFKIEDTEKIFKLIAENPLATVISISKIGELMVNHLPVFRKRVESGKLSSDLLFGHMSKMNPQWKHFQELRSLTLVFHGANAYISPTWYRSGRDVPTWNYLVVHLSCSAKVLESYDDLIEILRDTSERMESLRPRAWSFELPEDLKSREQLTKAIVGFEFRIEKIESKFKLNQNRPVEDKLGVIEGLLQTKDCFAIKIAEEMQPTKLIVSNPLV